MEQSVILHWVKCLRYQKYKQLFVFSVGSIVTHTAGRGLQCSRRKCKY